MNNNSIKIKKLVGLSILTALVVVLQLISNYVTIGTVNITLALMPIAVGAILYGPLAGLFLGAVMGAIILTAPSTQSFFSVNPLVTVLLCLIKSGLAGLLSGLLYKLFNHYIKDISDTKKKRILTVVAITCSTIIIPSINTFIFVCGAALFFYSVWGLESMSGAFGTILVAVFGTNFVIEFVVNVVLTPAVITILKVVTRNNDLGFVNDFSSLQNEEDFTSPSNNFEELNK